MKQHIDISQLNELSDKAKEELREWWKPKEGDSVHIPEDAKRFSYGKQIKGFESCGFIGSFGLAEGLYEWDVKNNKPSIEVPEYGSDNYIYTLAEECLPLLSIGQMISFLDLNNLKLEQDWYPLENKSYWQIWCYDSLMGDDLENLNSAKYLGKESWGKAEELCDALWQACKAILGTDLKT